MEDGKLMVMPARARVLSVVCGLALLVGGLLALVGLLLPWEVSYYPLDYRVPDSPPDPAQPMFHITPLGNEAGQFANALLNRSPAGVGTGLVCGAVFLAPPLALVALGLLVCATRRWRATGVAVSAACAGLAVALLVAWLYTVPLMDDSFSWRRPDVGVAVAALGYGCALAAGIAGRVFRLDR